VKLIHDQIISYADEVFSHKQYKTQGARTKKCQEAFGLNTSKKQRLKAVWVLGLQTHKQLEKHWTHAEIANDGSINIAQRRCLRAEMDIPSELSVKDLQEYIQNQNHSKFKSILETFGFSDQTLLNKLVECGFLRKLVNPDEDSFFKHNIPSKIFLLSKFISLIHFFILILINYLELTLTFMS